MEALRQRRGPLHAALTKVGKALEEELKAEMPDKENLAGLIAQLEGKEERLSETDAAIFRLLQETTCSQEEYGREFESSEEYKDRFTLWLTRARRKLTGLEKGPSREEHSYKEHNSKRKYRLPEIELKKFGGEITDWLCFWGQFRKLHEDSEVDDEDKFQYLMQATIPGSKARQLVESFPPSAENYPKAIDVLKSRFGREDALVEVYVRELLRLVLSNTLNPRQPVQLTTLYDKLETQLRALESLGVTSDKYAAMLYPLIESCLPEDVLRVWERHRTLEIMETGADVAPGEKTSKMSLLMSFLRREVEGEQRIQFARSGFGMEQDRKRNVRVEANEKAHNLPTAAGLFAANQQESYGKGNTLCIFCDKSHATTDCKRAATMPLHLKRYIIRRKNVCFTCFQFGHISKNCSAQVSCQICMQRHYAVVCPSQPGKVNQQEKTKSTKGAGAATATTGKEQSLTNGSTGPEVLLQTVRVKIRGRLGDQIVRALIDTGSQRSYVNDKLMVALGYQSLGTREVVHGLFGGVESRHVHQSYLVHLSSLDGTYLCNFCVLDQPKICTSVPTIQEGQWTVEARESGLDFTDYGGCSSECSPDIYLLIGADVAGKLLTGRVQSLSCGPIAVETKLGWTLMGKIPSDVACGGSAMMALTLHVKDASLKDLWSLDVLGIQDPGELQTRKDLQQAAMQHFEQTVKRTDCGRYVVGLPWLEGHPPLPDNLRVAQARLKGLVRKLQADNMYQDYDAIFAEWLDEGIIEEVPVDSMTEQRTGHYLPHRAVVKEGSTTRIRPVFDASSGVPGQPSLNNCLEKGPNLVELIPSVLGNFRLRSFGVIADIRRAFLQVGIHVKDRDCLRFLWCSNGDSERVKVYRHCRLVFGVSSSPFLLGATIVYHLERAPEPLKETARMLKESLYVDNCVLSVAHEHELEKFIVEARQLMSMAKFDLRGWRHNSNKDLLDLGPYGDPDTTPDKKEVAVLGLCWSLQEDTLGCHLPEVEKLFGGPTTKRTVLSAVARVFDPIGFTCPVTLLPKIQIQRCWKLKASWDEELPDSEKETFERWIKELPRLREIQVPRKLCPDNYSSKQLTLHVFSDASQHAYAACIFLRTEESDGAVCQLIQAKSRVAPLKTLTIPRLELMACSIGARLASSIKKELHLEDIPTFYWSDSTTALYWIKCEDQWGIFVWNRVAEIRSLSITDNWHYVPGAMNPADLPSRGCRADQLLRSRWWEGPSWLRLPPETWPREGLNPDRNDVDAERKKAVISVLDTGLESNWYYRRFSSYQKITRMIAWIFRFCTNVRMPTTEEKASGELTKEEFQRAETCLMRLIQQDSFQGNLDKYRSLMPWLDSEGVWRLKTKLLFRDDTDSFKQPILLPSDHPVVGLLILNKHRELCHAGVSTVLTALREEFWILRSRRTIRKTLAQCGRCRRFETKRMTSTPAPLPLDRVREAAAFEIVGIDLTGPLFLKGGDKAWIVLFTCAVYRAVHLELVKSLSTEAFLQALRRFVARRGRPTVIYSDNGTNFVGAGNELKQLNWNCIQERATVQKITWKFIPPTAAWWGGWWERLIGLMKQLLRKVLGRASLGYEELVTILCDCESVLNQRPLTYVANDVDDLTPLTPVMFLRDIKLDGVPDLDVVSETKLSKRAAYLQRLRANLRRRFRQEYLGQLRQQNFGIADRRKLSSGDVVLIGSDNAKRLDWPLAKVLELIPGRDGHVRVARVKTTTGELLRPLQRLYPMEMSGDDSLLPDKLEDRHVPDKLKEPNMKDTRKKKTPVKDEQTTAGAVRTRSGRTVKTPQRLIL